ncbi:FadR/GntR family transcriptional regulator [Effusibacillus dendaii]|uniref:GntR family transcriptional regulator n=1 Tax=Effusibacillus dendaii TaxID=2743772 RepID=A0A7I8DCF8_9BACL|nr:FadR/GntR family transcriptional regulator [Effusibacillus dendaii]BCJ85601.1 GntR family transcriptional regulator [Effusibacillus dendaii]
MFEPISDNTAFSQKIVSQITDAIVRGELSPGDRLPTERELGNQFGVSRTVVRDAIKLLAGRGILHVRHGVGIFVSESQMAYAEMDGALYNKDNSIKDLFEIRKVLECETVVWAAQRATNAQLNRLQQILNDASANVDNLTILGERDAQFHVGLAEASCNLVSVRLMLTMLDLLSESRMESLSIEGRPQRSLVDHQQILDAIKQKDGQLAKQRMLAHLTGVEESIRFQIKK